MKRLGAAITVALAMVGTTAMRADAADSRLSGAEHFQVLTVQQGPGRLVADGIFNAVGIVHDHTNIDPVAGTYDNVANMQFADGTLNFLGAGSTAITFLGPACTGIATIDGHFTVRDGTGRYEGVSGSGTLKGYVFLVFTPVPPSSCSTAPVAVLAVALADGTLTNLKSSPSLLTAHIPLQ